MEHTHRKAASFDVAVNDEWSGLADFLTNMIEKYAGQIDLDELSDPDRYYRNEQIREMYGRYARLSARARNVIISQKENLDASRSF